jgi:hypothetical protein
VDEHEADTKLSENDRTGYAALENALRTVWWLGLGTVAAGYAVLVPLATLLLGVRVLSRAAVDVSLLVVGLLVTAVAYWRLVWWVETKGIAQWQADDTDAVDIGGSAATGWED